VLALGAIQQKLSIDGIGWANQGRAWIDPAVLQAGGVGRSRWIGIFDGPGVFCVLFTLSLPFVLQQLGKGLAVWRRVLGGVLLLLLLGAVYSTGSRGGFLATLAVIGLHGMLRTGMSLRAIAISCGLVLLAYSFAPEHLTTVRDQSRSGQHRVEMWAEGLDMIKEAPLFGIGRGNFKAYTSWLIAHNSAVEMGGETGLVGLFLWVGLIYLSVKGTVAYLQSTEKPKEQQFCVALILSVIGYLISAMFVTLENEVIYLLLAVCAVIARCAPIPVRLETRDYLHVGAIVVAWIVVLQIFVIRFFA
jgi:O-antigen ligase